MLSKNKITSISNILKKIPGLAAGYLHGSALTKYFKPDSDIDIGLLFLPDKNKAFFTEDVMDYSIEIESITGHITHFSKLSSYHIVFSREVVTKGQLIVCNDKYFCDTFTMHTLSMYANLNYERREILEQYTA
jgi:predicted nucleotidyltransferase